MALYEKQQIQKRKQNIKDLERNLKQEKGTTESIIRDYIGEMQQLEEKIMESEGIDLFFVKCCQLFSPNGVIRLGVLYERAVYSNNGATKEHKGIAIEEVGKYINYIKDFKLNDLVLQKIYNVASQTEETLVVYKNGRVELATTKSVFE